MKFQKGDLVKWNDNFAALEFQCMLITDIIDEIYYSPYGEGYEVFYVGSNRKETISQKALETNAERIG